MKNTLPDLDKENPFYSDKAIKYWKERMEEITKEGESRRIEKNREEQNVQKK
jgi:hypothetical protein